MTTWRDQQSKEFLRNADDTLIQTLTEIIHITKPTFRPLPGFPSTAGGVDERIKYGLDCDEVYSNIFIGDAGAAQDKDYLKRLGITHVLNTAEGSRFGMVNTSQSFYKGTDIKYMGLKLLDLPTTTISTHFQETADFIESGVASGGKVLVHCLMGMSRSSTCVLSYLMIKESLSAAKALRRVRTCRDIRPNDGFLRQLAELDNKLKRERLRSHV